MTLRSRGHELLSSRQILAVQGFQAFLFRILGEPGGRRSRSVHCVHALVSWFGSKWFSSICSQKACCSDEKPDRVGENGWGKGRNGTCGAMCKDVFPKYLGNFDNMAKTAAEMFNKFKYTEETKSNKNPERIAANTKDSPSSNRSGESGKQSLRETVDDDV